MENAMKTLIATAALVAALASPSFALNPQATLGSTAQVGQDTTQSAAPTLVRERRGDRRWSRGYRRGGCQGARDPRDPYICNYMGHYN
jgi:hypothetical protein